MIYSSPSLLRKVLVIPSELLSTTSVDIRKSIARRSEIELSEKIFEELKTKKSLILTLVKDNEISQVDHFTSEIITDVNIISTKDFINRLLKIFDDAQNTEYNSNSPEYHKGVYDTVQLFRKELHDLLLILNKEN